MAWILDEYSKFHGHSPAVVTGKPIVSSTLETPKITGTLSLSHSLSVCLSVCLSMYMQCLIYGILGSWWITR